ncbi:hypothetical protein [Mesorhizobium sp. 2RAF21]|uniref:hypothetical protein n=1 Tax=Mesorhizobium sp. 2RAF21 TaxID=3232995 RepID=UPI003F9A8028
MHGRAKTRETIAKGRQANQQLDIVCEALRKHPEIDVDALREGRYTRRKVDGPEAQSAMSADDSTVIRGLVARLHDENELDDFDLVYRNDRVKSDSSGLDLIKPKEMKLLERLAGLQAGAGQEEPRHDEHLMTAEL